MNVGYSDIWGSSAVYMVGKKGEELDSKTLSAKALRDVRTEKGSFFFCKH